MNVARRAPSALLMLAALAALFLLLAALAGQARIVTSDQLDRGSEQGIGLWPGHTAGQTFVARHDGLSGAEFYLRPGITAPLTLTLHLRDGPESTADIASASLHLSPDAQPDYYRFDLSPLPLSHGMYYYAVLETVAPGVSVPQASGEAYLDGSAYEVDQPLDAQTSFRLVYAPGIALLGLLRRAAGGLGLVAGALFLIVVPGWALLAWVLPDGRVNWAEMLTLAVGVGLAIYPVLILWTHLAGLDLGQVYAWLPGALGIVALTWRYRGWRPRRACGSARRWLHSEALWPDLALLAVAALVFGTRILMTGALETPLWGDGYQHTMIAQLIADNRGLYESWAPYAELTTFTYHFGFHGVAAAYHWLTGLPVLSSTVWTSQLVNALAVLSLYPLGLRVSGSRWGGVWAVLLAGLLSPMPMAYTNWGRFTQLAGLAILPAAVWITWEAVEAEASRWRLVALGALVVGGLALTHYRILLFYGAFVLGLLLVSLRRKSWRHTLLSLGVLGLGAALLFAPWFANAFGGEILRIVGYQITTLPAEASSFDTQYNQIGPLNSYLAPVWWLGTLLGIGVGFWKRQRGALIIALWWLLLLLGTNPGWFSLPGSGVITNFALVISAYVPASLFTGILVVWLLSPLAKRRWGPAVAAVLLVCIGAWGAWVRLGDVDLAAGALVTRPDVRAAAWIRDHTPPEAHFLVNSFPAYGDSVVVGSDGGWWLPLLAARQSTVPPLNYGTEQGPDPEYRSRVNELARQVQERGPDDPAVVNRLREQGVTHVYVGQRQGRVNYWGPGTLDPQALLRSTHFRLLYHQDRVWVFEIRQ